MEQTIFKIGTTYKVIFREENSEKLLRGKILKEDEFTFVIKDIKLSAEVVVGKAAIIKAIEQTE